MTALPDAPLAEIEVLVVDCQTTGASPALGSVLELGYCLTSASDPSRESAAAAHWIVPPAGLRISAPVRQLTGFHEGVLESAIAPEEAWQRLRGLMREPGPTPAAIHFARFELSFLRNWCERFEPALSFPIEAVCVHAIACRLYPDLPRRNLRALAGFLGHGLHLERRSLGHVQATAFIWRKLVELLAERDVRTWRALQAWLSEPEKRAAPRKRRYPLPPARYRALPDQPGVYRFLRSNGDVLYVGKATSLKKRVSSHFTKQSGATERALEMLTQVSDIAYEATSTALEAALLETGTIKHLNPPYNVQLLLGQRQVYFTSTDLGSVSPEPDERHRVGPLSSRYAARALGALSQLLDGEAPGASRRAASVGAPLRWAPDAASFAEGWALFTQRHAAQLAAGRSARRRAHEVARFLLLRGELEPEPEADEPESAPSVWDGPRVCRHLERAASQAYQVLRRASWLCLLSHSGVTYREPSSNVTRFLRLEGAAIADSGERSEAQAPPWPARATRLERQGAFDAASYDSLRILSTELKRILRDGGQVTVQLSRSRAISDARLASLLKLT